MLPPRGGEVSRPSETAWQPPTPRQNYADECNGANSPRAKALADDNVPDGAHHADGIASLTGPRDAVEGGPPPPLTERGSDLFTLHFAGKLPASGNHFRRPATENTSAYHG